jgi:hypothetical protein
MRRRTSGFRRISGPVSRRILNTGAIKGTPFGSWLTTRYDGKHAAKPRKRERMQRRKLISRTLPEHPPEEMKVFLLEVSHAFDVTLATLHPDEMGDDRWLICLELPCGEEVLKYVQTSFATNPKYLRRWIESVHHYLVRKRSMR